MKYLYKTDTVLNLIANIEELQHQINQMRGMFSDEDGTIAAATARADEAVEEATAAFVEQDDIFNDIESSLSAFETMMLHFGKHLPSTDDKNAKWVMLRRGQAALKRL